MIQRELTATDYISMLRRRWVLIVVLSIVGGPLAYGVSLLLPNRYKSQTLVLVEQPTVPSEFVKPMITTEINQRLASMQEQILSRTRLEPLIHQFGLFQADINRLPMDELVVRFRLAIEVTPVQPMAETRSQELPGFRVSVTLDNARTAQQVCTTVTSMFIEENLRLRQQRSEDTTQFLGQQLKDAKAKLDEQDARLAAFKARYIGSLPDQEKTNLNLLTGLTSQLDAATQALGRAQQDKNFAASMLTQQLAAWQSKQPGQNPDTLQQQLSALETQLASLEARYMDDYPDVIKTKSDIAVLKRKIEESEDETNATDPGKSSKSSVEPQQIQQLRVQIHTFDQIISEKTAEQEQIKQQIKLYQARVQSSPGVEQQYKEITRDYQTALDFYNELLKNRNQSAMAADLERHQEGEQFRVLDPANLPEKPSFPNRPLFALGGFGGTLALGLGIAFLMEMRDTSLRSERDVEFALRLPVLAMVPTIEPVRSKKSKRQSIGSRLDRAAVE
jgi:polysaccharide chain length determinant protein (PEP-CTERM system associated)